MSWDIKKLKAEIGPRLTEIIVLVIVLSPTIYFVMDKVYNERFQILQERINIAQQRSDFFEAQLDKMGDSMNNGTDSVTPGRNGGVASTDMMMTDKVDSVPKNNLDPDRLPFSLVKRIAESYGLFETVPPNEHLKFTDDDITYWVGQKLNKDQLEKEFESRRIALVRAQNKNEKIESQGDLSFKAEIVQKELKK